MVYYVINYHFLWYCFQIHFINACFSNIDQQFKECEHYCETHTTVNTRNIYGMLLFCEK